WKRGMPGGPGAVPRAGSPGHGTGPTNTMRHWTQQKGFPMPRKASSPLALVVAALCLLGGACDRDATKSSPGTAGTGPTTATAVSPTTSDTVDATGASTPAANPVAGGPTTGASATGGA